MQITEHAGQAQPAQRPLGMDPATAGARSPLDTGAERSAARLSEEARSDRTERPAARTVPKPARYGAGF